MRIPQSFLNTSCRHGLLLYKFLKMENLQDPKFLEHSLATDRLRNPLRNSCLSPHCVDGEAEAREQMVPIRVHRKCPERQTDQTAPFY